MLACIRGVVDGIAQVCWNIGGGQKMQQMALMRVFQERLAVGYADWACYADPGMRKIYIIRGDRHNLGSVEIEVRTNISLKDVLTTFGLETRDKHTPLLLWNHSTADRLPPEDVFRDRTVFWDREKRRQLLDWVIEPKGDTPPILKGLKHGYADYFEHISQYEVATILRDHAPAHHITEAWANVRVKDQQGKEIAEWDIVLVTDFGTLIILDAKTGVFHSKDEHARLFNLERATGFYGEFWLIIPYLLEDVRDDRFYEPYGRKGIDIKKIPFELDKLNSRFLAITGQEQSFFLKKMKKEKVKVVEAYEGIESKKDLLEVPDIGRLLDILRLKRATS